MISLPVQLTSFVGRAAELSRARRLLATTRLLTLTGPGGAGKTRLALAVAERAAADFPDGVTFVALAALTDPALVPAAVATALGIPQHPDRTPLETIVFTLAGCRGATSQRGSEHRRRQAGRREVSSAHAGVDRRSGANRDVGLRAPDVAEAQVAVRAAQVGKRGRGSLAQHRRPSPHFAPSGSGTPSEPLSIVRSMLRDRQMRRM
jgi:hypothetical protein